VTTLSQAVSNLERFANGSLKNRIAGLQSHFLNLDKYSVSSSCDEMGIDVDLLDSALAVKRIAGEINVILHATGILLLLPQILGENEIIEALSLGAGNTGTHFDLETNQRIAEFKFIHWKGHDSIRQNTFFKDYYKLAEAETSKQRFLYVIDKTHPLKFLTGRRALRSVMSKDQGLQEHFSERYGERFSITSDYYSHWPKDWVNIVDIMQLIPNFALTLETINPENEG
jgi:hypothetical protein